MPDKIKTLNFVFDFKDELCYIPYNKETFSMFEKRMYSRVDDIEDEKEYYFIPIECLKTIQTYG